MMSACDDFSFFFFHNTSSTEIYTLSLHDALPISRQGGGDAAARLALRRPGRREARKRAHGSREPARRGSDRKSTRLNSSHGYISYAVFCLKKKKKKI